MKYRCRRTSPSADRQTDRLTPRRSERAFITGGAAAAPRPVRMWPVPPPGAGHTYGAPEMRTTLDEPRMEAPGSASTRVLRAIPGKRREHDSQAKNWTTPLHPSAALARFTAILIDSSPVSGAHNGREAAPGRRTPLARLGQADRPAPRRPRSPTPTSPARSVRSGRSTGLRSSTSSRSCPSRSTDEPVCPAR